MLIRFSLQGTLASHGNIKPDSDASQSAPIGPASAGRRFADRTIQICKNKERLIC